MSWQITDFNDIQPPCLNKVSEQKSFEPYAGRQLAEVRICLSDEVLNKNLYEKDSITEVAAKISRECQEKINPNLSKYLTKALEFCIQSKIAPLREK
jgi:hypothetical protein